MMAAVVGLYLQSSNTSKSLSVTLYLYLFLPLPLSLYMSLFCCLPSDTCLCAYRRFHVTSRWCWFVRSLHSNGKRSVGCICSHVYVAPHVGVRCNALVDLPLIHLVRQTLVRPQFLITVPNPYLLRTRHSFFYGVTTTRPSAHPPFHSSTMHPLQNPRPNSSWNGVQERLHRLLCQWFQEERAITEFS